jgi:hypothetical protein
MYIVFTFLRWSLSSVINKYGYLCACARTTIFYFSRYLFELLPTYFENLLLNEMIQVLFLVSEMILACKWKKSLMDMYNVCKLILHGQTIKIVQSYYIKNVGWNDEKHDFDWFVI